VTEIESAVRSVHLEDSGTWRLLWTQSRRDDGDRAELFVLVYAVKSVLGHGEYPGSVRTRHQSARSEPFLRRWQGAMNLWASRNCDILKDSLSCRASESDLVPRLRPIRDRILVIPASPARPELSSPALRTLEPSR